MWSKELVMTWMLKLRRNKTVAYGIPMMLLIIGGSFGLQEFTQIRYDAQKLQGMIDPALEQKLKKSNVTLESEYEKMKNATFDGWKNMRAPRPWEESTHNQDEQ